MNRLEKIKTEITELKLKRKNTKTKLKKAEKDFSKKVKKFGWNSLTMMQYYNNVNVFLKHEQQLIKKLKQEIEIYENSIEELIEHIKEQKVKLKN